jgi:chromosomal replication initiator protein
LADGADVVDSVIEIPLPGRALCRSVDELAPDAAPIRVRAFVAGRENCLLAAAIDRCLLPPNSTSAEQLPDIDVASLGVLAIHGPSGTGKTHLAQGLLRHWQASRGAEAAEYFTAADFRRALVDAIKQEAVDKFRRRVRHRPLVVMDDIDRLPNDDYLQQELRYTIDAIEENRGLLVVTSSRAVGTLRNLAAEVRSRLAAGLVVPAMPPDVAARKRLIVHLSALLALPLSDSAADRLAAKISGTARDLFGALFELSAQSSRRPVDDVEWVDGYLASRSAWRPAMRDIVARVAKYYRLPQKMLTSDSRRQSVVFARSIAVYLARELAGLSYERIGRALGGRDHSTIMHGYRKIAAQLRHDAKTREAVEELLAQLTGQ